MKQDSDIVLADIHASQAKIGKILFYLTTFINAFTINPGELVSPTFH